MRIFALLLLFVLLSGCTQRGAELPTPYVPPIVVVDPSPSLIEVVVPPIELDQTLKSFSFQRNKTHTQPKLYINDEILEKYKVIAVGPKEGKLIYLTFDCGYENGFTALILDVLAIGKVTASFFVTGQYVKGNRDMVTRMYNEGHIIANHTMTHPSMETLEQSVIKQELLGVDALLFPITGIERTWFVRPPMGNFSEHSLGVTGALGYYTVFWTMAYVDWLTDKQPGADYAYNHVIDNIHPGAVILLHAVSQSNADALSKIVGELKVLGYVFRPLSDFLPTN